MMSLLIYAISQFTTQFINTSYSSVSNVTRICMFEVRQQVRAPHADVFLWNKKVRRYGIAS